MGQEAVSQASFAASQISAIARNSPGLPAATLLHQQRVEKRAARSFRTSSPGLPAATLLLDREMRSPELNFAGGCYASFLCSKSNIRNSAKLTRAACSNSPSSTTSRETRSPKFPHQLTRAACSNSPFRSRNAQPGAKLRRRLFRKLPLAASQQVQ